MATATGAGVGSGVLATGTAVLALALNYGARSVLPVIAHVVCDGGATCDPAALVGSVTSAFFMGDLMAQAASKPLAKDVGGSRLLALSAGGLGASLGLVMLLEEGPRSIFLFAQLFLGFWCGLGYPAAHALLAEAVPKSRRSTAVSFIVGASALGTMLGNLATPLAVQAVGWWAPLAFFAFSSLAAALFISSALRAPALAPSAVSASTMPPPSAATTKAVAAVAASSGWMEFRCWMADPLVQALVVAMYASGVANTFLYSFLPTLFVEVYGAQISELAGLTTSAPMANAMMCVASGVIADRIVGRYGWRTFQCRRLMQFLGTSLPAASLFALAAAGPALGTAPAAGLVTVWMASHGFQTAGLTAAFHDVAELRASELFAVGNIFSKLAGVLAGKAFSIAARALSWEAVLAIIAVHYVVSGFVLIAQLSRTEETRLMFKRSSGHDPEGGNRIVAKLGDAGQGGSGYTQVAGADDRKSNASTASCPDDVSGRASEGEEEEQTALLEQGPEPELLSSDEEDGPFETMAASTKMILVRKRSSAGDISAQFV